MPDAAPNKQLLPDDGRLLFFFDLASYDLGVWTAKVIWDKAPADELEAVAFPDALLKAHEEDAVEWRKNDAYAADLARQYDNEVIDPASLPETSQFIFPSRTVEPHVQFVLPEQGTLEFAQIGIETFESDGEEFWLGDLIGEVNHQRGQAVEDYLFNTRMLGTPTPEQDDPRLYATDFGGGEGTDWAVLLQIDVSGLVQRDGEGTIYFVIRKDDLEKRNFDGVVGLYQQT